MANLDQSKIPDGPYCYASLEPMDERGIIRLNGLCPYWQRIGESPFCTFLNGFGDGIGLLDDQVKVCGVNDETDGSE